MSKILLPSKKNVTSPEEDVYLDVSLHQSGTLMPIDLFEKLVSNYEVYLQERNKSTLHRVYGNIKVIASNVLCNFDGPNSYEQIEIMRNYDEELQSYQYTLEEILFQNNGWYYYINPNAACFQIELEPKKSRFQLDEVNNWQLFLTYSYKTNLKPILFNNIDIKDGIAIMASGELEVDGKILTYFVCPLTHNLQVGDTVNIYNEDGFVNRYTVYQLGLNDNTYKKNVFFIDEKVDFSPEVLSKKYRFKKIIGEVESIYYSRWYKKLTSVTDYDVFKTSFGKNVFEDQDISFIYPKSLDLDGVKDNLNRPVTELFLTLIKKGDDNFWGKTLCGLNTFLSNIDYDFNMLFDGGTLSEIEVISNQDVFFGNIVEYNERVILEQELNFAVHIFNTKNRLQNSLYESYYYKPHYKVDLFSSDDFISKEDGISDPPDYAIDYNGLKAWRNLTRSNFIPYLNKNHYVYYNLNVFIRRQDPCKRYGMGDNALISGRCLDIDSTKITDVTKIC